MKVASYVHPYLGLHCFKKWANSQIIFPFQQLSAFTPGYVAFKQDYLKAKAQFYIQHKTQKWKFAVQSTLK